MSDGNLVSITMVSAVSEIGQVYVTVTATSEDGRSFVGQLPPALMRTLGHECFVVAEEAEVDSVLSKVMKEKFLLDETEISYFLLNLRKARGNA
jgi:hypothetical protein